MGVDGCGVPVHGMPLRSMATLFARLTATERLGDLAPAADRVTEAMRSEPYLVGGRNRVDTDLMRTTPDVVAKSGAEALECAAVLSSGLGVAVKIEDGGSRASAPALIRVLEQIDVLSADHLRGLAYHASPPVLGGGKPVGALEAVFDLRFRRPQDRQEAVTRYASSRVTSAVMRKPRVAVLSVHTSPMDQPGSGDSGGMNVYIRAVAERLAEHERRGRPVHPLPRRRRPARSSRSAPGFGS